MAWSNSVGTGHGVNTVQDLILGLFPTKTLHCNLYIGLCMFSLFLLNFLILRVASRLRHWQGCYYGYMYIN